MGQAAQCQELRTEWEVCTHQTLYWAWTAWIALLPSCGLGPRLEGTYNVFVSQLPRVALMEQFVWSMDLWRVLAGWRSASMDCGEECVVLTCWIVIIPELCVDSWGTVATQTKVS